MKLFNLVSMLFLSTFLFTSCGSDTPKDDYGDMAKELCTCMQPLAELYEEVKEASIQQDTARLEALVMQFSQISDQGELCADQLEKKYGTFKTEEEELKARAAMEKACPNIVKLMEGEEY